MKKHNQFTGKDLTIVICAYGECPYLPQSIQAVKNQSVKTRVLISTSTPNDQIQGLADQYGIEVRINPDGGHVKDYNFAMNQVDTALGMLAHQDDLLEPDFVDKNLSALNRAKRPVISFCNYLEMHEDVADKKPSGMVRIKRLLLLPFRIPHMGRTAVGKWITQCIGNPITHPTVVCVMREMPKELFREQYRASMDWDLWQRLSRQKGEFVYVKEVLLYHRMNKENATVRLLEHTNARYEEEFEILNRFWPKGIVRILMRFYSKSANYY